VSRIRTVAADYQTEHNTTPYLPKNLFDGLPDS
jgi:hypothetical protein